MMDSAASFRRFGLSPDQKVKPGGPEGWDYLTVDQATHPVFISRGTMTDQLQEKRTFANQEIGLSSRLERCPKMTR